MYRKELGIERKPPMETTHMTSYTYIFYNLISVLFLIYAPVASVGYFTLGDCVNDNIIMSLSKGPVKTAAEVVLLLHLVTHI